MKTNIPGTQRRTWLRRIATTLAMAGGVTALSAFDTTPYPGGFPPDGSPAYPWKVDQAADFDMIGTDGTHGLGDHYLLVTDLDFADAEHWVRGIFTGSFDGDYHTVSSLRINQPGIRDVGLFSRMGPGGDVRRLAVTDSYLRAAGAMGAITGGMSHSTRIEECMSVGNELHAVATNQQAVGGITGGGSFQTPAAVVKNSLARNNVQSAVFQTVGGISGYNDARIESCYTAGNTLTAPRYVGGLEGYGYGAVVDSYSDATNSPSVQVGELPRGSWSNPLIPRNAIGFDMTPYSITQLGWDTTVWCQAPDGYPRLLGFNRAPGADAGTDQVVECTGLFTEATLDGSASLDPDGDPLDYQWSVAPGASLDSPTSAVTNGQFPLGSTMATLTVTDCCGAFDTADVTVTVSDTVAPRASCTTDLAELWPPNHKVVTVGIFVTVEDTCDEDEALLVDCTVSSNEPDGGDGDVDGEDGHAAPVPVELDYDAQLGMFVGEVELRAERLGTGTGRSYSVTCEVSDASGNTTTASCVVVVPHDRRGKGRRK